MSTPSLSTRYYIIYTVVARALGHSFLLFLRHQELLSEEYDIAVAALGTQQLANRSHR